MITAWSVASLLGPNTLTFLRARSYNQSAEELAAQIDPVRFQGAFGSPPEQLSSLLEAKAVTIGRLMEIAPVGTIDPSPNLYDTTLYSMGGKSDRLACIPQRPLLTPGPSHDFSLRHCCASMHLWTGVLLVAFGVASALSPAEKHLTIIDTPDIAAADSPAESTGLEGVTEGRGKMHLGALTGAEKEVQKMERAVSDTKNQ
jgi:hypothetical protein